VGWGRLAKITGGEEIRANPTLLMTIKLRLKNRRVKRKLHFSHQEETSNFKSDGKKECRHEGVRVEQNFKVSLERRCRKNGA